MFLRLKKAWKVLFQDNRVNHQLEDWEKEKGLLISRIKGLENKLIDKRMMMIEKVLDAKASQNTEAAMLAAVVGMVTGNKNTLKETTETPPTPQTEITLTEEQIRAMINANPKIKKVGKVLDDQTLRTQIINYVPNISKPSLEKTIEVIRE